MVTAPFVKSRHFLARAGHRWASSPIDTFFFPRLDRVEGRSCTPNLFTDDRRSRVVLAAYRT